MKSSSNFISSILTIVLIALSFSLSSGQMNGLDPQQLETPIVQANGYTLKIKHYVALIVSQTMQSGRQPNDKEMEQIYQYLIQAFNSNPAVVFGQVEQAWFNVAPQLGISPGPTQYGQNGGFQQPGMNQTAPQFGMTQGTVNNNYGWGNPNPRTNFNYSPGYTNQNSVNDYNNWVQQDNMYYDQVQDQYNYNDQQYQLQQDSYNYQDSYDSYTPSYDYSDY